MMMVCLMAFCMLSYHMMRLSRFIVDCRRSTTAQRQSTPFAFNSDRTDDMHTRTWRGQHCFLDEGQHAQESKMLSHINAAINLPHRTKVFEARA